MLVVHIKYLLFVKKVSLIMALPITWSQLSYFKIWHNENFELHMYSCIRGNIGRNFTCIG